MRDSNLRKKRHLPTMLSLLLTMTLIISACSSTGGSDGADGNTNDDGTSEIGEQVLDNKTSFKFDPPISFTTALTFQQQTDRDFKPGESIEDHVHLRWMRDELGLDVSYDFVVPNSEDYETKMRLLLSGNQDLPDVMTAFTGLANDLITAKKVMPLNDIIDQYLTPNLKALYEEYPAVLYPVTRDGVIYGLPNMYAMDEGTIMWVREDWLQNVGLDAPKTLEEFEEVLRAFTEDDPDQNGQDDTLGLAVSLKDGPFQWMASADPIVGMFSDYVAQTTDPAQFWHEEDGKLIYGTTHPAQKEFLAQMNEWMELGYIDPEAGIKDPTKAAEMVASGQAGVIFGPYWMNGYPLSGSPEFQPYPNPAGPGGQVGRAEKQMVHDYVMFNADFEHPEAVIAYINKLFAANFGEDDPYYDPQFKNGWHEGYDYVEYEGEVYHNNFEENGLPVSEWPKPDDPTVTYSIKFPITGAPFVPYLGDPAFQKFKDDPDAQSNSAMETRIKSSQARQLDAGLVRISQNDTAIHNQFAGPPTKTMLSKSELLTKLESESYLKIIYGDEPIEYFDQFVEEWKANGGDQLIQEVNEWYETTK